jgi:hypothetical protein
LEDLQGLSIKKISENENEILLELENGINLNIDLTNQAYSGSEALSLYGPNNLVIVWN